MQLLIGRVVALLDPAAKKKSRKKSLLDVQCAEVQVKPQRVADDLQEEKPQMRKTNEKGKQSIIPRS